jgi:PhnB protein
VEGDIRMKKIIPEIHIKNCIEAVKYYKEVFGGEIKNEKMADGIESFKGHEGKLIHAELHINPDCVLYFADVFNEKGVKTYCNLILEMDSEEEINRIYSKLKENGKVRYELQKTFWGAYHAVIEDNYGNTWSLNYTLR